jgi:hypothetical protein
MRATIIPLIAMYATLAFASPIDVKPAGDDGQEIGWKLDQDNCSNPYNEYPCVFSRPDDVGFSIQLHFGVCKT